MLDGVDISGWDKGIRVADVEADLIIIKATEGLQGVRYNPDYAMWADTVLNTGRLLGFYHYANGKNPEAEAASFWDAIHAYQGQCVPCLDWEGQGNDKFESGEDVSWCLRFLDKLAALSGATPLIYMSKSVTNEYDWSSVAAKYPLWGAQYADYEPVYGYDHSPWQSAQRWGAWGNEPTLFQYTSTLRLAKNGGITDFDGNLFYGTAEDWTKLCGGEGSVTPVPTPNYRDIIVQYCRDNIGCAYDYTPSGGVEGVSYNCSYLSTCAYAAAELTIPGWQGHQNGDGSQSDWVRDAGNWTDNPDELKAGDLVFFGSNPYNTSHVGVSLGGTAIIDSIPDGGVQERELYDNFVGGGWPLEDVPGGGEAPTRGLDVDGWAGPATVRAMQRALGTTVDGIISGQARSDDRFVPAVTAREHGRGGSEMVRAMQYMVGVGADGYWGRNTSTALQRHLCDRGYEVDVDGYFGNGSVRALQRCLNDGALC